LFAAPPRPENVTVSAVEKALELVNPDTLSPREALDALYQLKALAAKP
jgi:DNA mismatch repair protein MutS